jgi:hypothetical protein
MGAADGAGGVNGGVAGGAENERLFDDDVVVVVDVVVDVDVVDKEVLFDVDRGVNEEAMESLGEEKERAI